MMALLDRDTTSADTPAPHQCSDRPALGTPWCPRCSALLDTWIITDDATRQWLASRMPDGKRNNDQGVP
jgi:hypothetical protein